MKPNINSNTLSQQIQVQTSQIDLLNDRLLS